MIFHFFVLFILRGNAYFLAARDVWQKMSRKNCLPVCLISKKCLPRLFRFPGGIFSAVYRNNSSFRAVLSHNGFLDRLRPCVTIQE
jgi:hypothetical protein